MHRRPPSQSSGRSTRSRRDEVWEMKRQRWMQRNRGGNPGCGQPAQQQRSRAPPLGDLSNLQQGPSGPKSPLSQLVAEGYPQGQMQSSVNQKPNSRGGGGGFDANVAGQWNANVANDVVSRQNRHDPAVSGPAKQSHGLRVAQPSGGNSNIDLSWGASHPAVSSHPPRMPGSGGSGGSGGQQQYSGAPPQQMNYGQQQQMNYGQQQQQQPAYALDQRYGRGSSPSRGGLSSPWGRDDQQHPPVSGGRGGHPGQQQAPPFGVDGGLARSNSRGPRGLSPSANQQQQIPQYGGMAPESMAAGAGHRGRQAHGIRPPGGQSSVIFG